VRGDRDQALAMYAIAVTANQRIGQPRGLAHAYHNMAITYRQIGMLDRADEHERRAIECAAEAGSHHLAALARAGRAEISLMRGDAAVAEMAALRVAVQFAELNDPIQRANALRVVGAARTALGSFREAQAALDEGLMLARQHSAALIEAELLRARAELRVWLDQRHDARDDARAAIRIFDRLDATDDRARLARWLDAMERSATPSIGSVALRS
jgi:tetratricopeptide (TPR) repeat protein